MSDEEEERTIFDACMTFTEVCEADEAGDATTLADFTKSLEEVRTFLAGKGAETADDIDMFAGEDGIELTMAAVGRHSADQVTLSLCWQVLSLVCVNAEMRRSIKNAGAFDYLLAALRDFDAVPAMQVVLLQMAERLCSKDESSKVQLHELGGIDHLLSLFDSMAEEPAVLEAALNVLRVMLLDDDKEKRGLEHRGISAEDLKQFAGQFAAELKKKDALNMVFDLLDGEQPDEVKGAAFRVLTLLCTHGELCLEAIDNGVIDIALEVLKSPSELSAGLTRAVVTLLRSIALQSEEGKGLLVGEGAAGLLLPAIKAHSGSARVLDMALVTTLTLIFQDTTQSASLVANGLLKVVKVALEQHGSDKAVFRSACMLLRELCRTIEQRTLILEQGFEEVINKGMLTHEGAKYAGDTQSLTEYGRDVLRDSKSDKYEASKFSMGINLVELCGF